jgi:hypothetical protein
MHSVIGPCAEGNDSTVLWMKMKNATVLRILRNSRSDPDPDQPYYERRETDPSQNVRSDPDPQYCQCSIKVMTEGEKTIVFIEFRSAAKIVFVGCKTSVHKRRQVANDLLTHRDNAQSYYLSEKWVVI